MDIDEATAERDKFLKNNPKYKEYQAEIERILDGVPDPAAKMNALSIMLSCKLAELSEQMNALHSKTSDMATLAKQILDEAKEQED